MTESGEAAQRLAIVCERADDIRRRLRDSPARDDAVLEELLTAAREGGETAGPVDVLHGVLRALGDYQGLYTYSGDGMRAGDRGVHLAGADREHASEPVYLCPAARCTRSWWPQGPVPVPRCAISGDALRRDRL
ncbi:hypothetical protein [Streptomyces scabiei]|uniref:hypothetical protein n=1 Tax=Streptomyces scabiei TaxID=1930 RepID=UPI0029B86348|nr:hypothetical protein [Streptomyces scabiei]MDX3113314.1 hypothetical protein [Streptomyces scabiei]